MHTTSSMNGKYVRPCETNFSPTRHQSGRRPSTPRNRHLQPPEVDVGVGMTPDSSYKPPAKRRLESLRNP